MLLDAKNRRKTVGKKQSQRAIQEGKAQEVYLARDAEPRIRQEIAKLCEDAGVPVTEVETMAALGKACGIQVGAAVVALLNP